jgi:hypothetical protein
LPYSPTNHPGAAQRNRTEPGIADNEDVEDHDDDDDDDD